MDPRDRKLDWVPQFDPRSRGYGIRAVVRQGIVVPRTVMWREGVVLDQGSEGACVGFAWMAEALAEPVMPEPQPMVAAANRKAISYYKMAQKLDDFPGEDYSGTSVLAGAKVMKREGWIDGYRWCFSIDEVRDALISQGPVVIGVPWYESMYQTDAHGLVKIEGQQVGGHAILLTGYDRNRLIGDQTLEVFRWRNSWGSSYGVNGSAYITCEDLSSLLDQGGEACVPIGRKVAPFGPGLLGSRFPLARRVVSWFRR
jgi:hypothetical protein